MSLNQKILDSMPSLNNSKEDQDLQEQQEIKQKVIDNLKSLVEDFKQFFQDKNVECKFLDEDEMPIEV